MIPQPNPLSDSVVQNGEIDLIELARVLWRQRKLIIGITIVTTICATLLSFLLPKTYKAQATILPMTGGDTSMALASSIAAQLGPMASMLGGVTSNKSADLTEILGSRTMANRVIEKYNLEHEVQGWKHRNELTDKLQKMTSIEPPTMKSKTLSIKVQATSPTLAATIANGYVAELKGILDEIGYNNATKNRKFLEEQLAKTKTTLANAEEELTRFQAANQIASLPETVMTSIKTISELEAQRIGASVEIQGTTEALGEIKSRIGSLETTPGAITQLEIKRKSLAAQELALENAQRIYLDKFTKLPPKAMALARLQRDVQVQNAIYLALTQQYQAAFIDESKESNSFLLLDKAEEPLRPTSPNKLLYALTGLIAGLSIGAISVLIARSACNGRQQQAA